MSKLVRVSRAMRALLIVCAAVLVAVPSATAEPLTIDRGFFTVGGTFGVDLAFNTPDVAPTDPAPFVGEGNGIPPAGFASFFCTTCSPPRTLPVMNVTFANVIDPSSNSSCPGCSYSGNLTFRLPAQPIPHDEDAFRALFTMAGTFEGFAASSGSRVFQHDLKGSGFAIVESHAVTFGFEPSAAPTPEPESALLLLTGVCCVARRLARNRRLNRSCV
jgi:hypothetical protein